MEYVQLLVDKILKVSRRYILPFLGCRENPVGGRICPLPKSLARVNYAVNTPLNVYGTYKILSTPSWPKRSSPDTLFSAEPLKPAFHTSAPGHNSICEYSRLLVETMQCVGDPGVSIRPTLWWIDQNIFFFFSAGGHENLFAEVLVWIEKAQLSYYLYRWQFR